MRQFPALLMGLFVPLALAAGGGGGDDKPPSTYLELSPAFVVNIGESAGSYAKAQVTLRFHEAKARKQAQAHTPWLRHEVVMLMSGRSVDELQRPEGQTKLRHAIRKAANERLVSEIPALAKNSGGNDNSEGHEDTNKEEESGDGPKGPVREVLLPDFIVQAR